LPIRKYESNNILLIGRNSEMMFCDEVDSHLNNMVSMLKIILLTIYLIRYISKITDNNIATFFLVALLPLMFFETLTCFNLKLFLLTIL
jgi:hypothetical protein